VATDPLLGIAEELYALPPGEFTGTRNQWVKQTRAGGDTELAGRVGELRKPSMAAWVVNMMMRHQGEQMAQVLELGASLRQAQADLDGDALRELTRQRRQLTTAVTHQGRVLAGELGSKVTEAVADQVQDTLHAAMVDEGAAAAVRSGMLVAALSATGVGSVDAGDAVAVPAAIGLTARPRSRPPATAAAGRGALSVVPPSQRQSEPQPGPDLAEQARAAEHEARLTAARTAVEQAVAAADEAQRRLRKAQRRITKVQARTLQAADELDQARRRVAELEHALEGLDDESTSAEERSRQAEQRYADAQAALEQARAALDGLS
jgi:hypothetical protein